MRPASDRPLQPPSPTAPHDAGEVTDVDWRPLAGGAAARPAPPAPAGSGDGAIASSRARGDAVRPNLRGGGLLQWIALGFGAGLSPLAPGTVGTLWAWLSWALLAGWLTPAQQGALIAGAAALGWWAATVTARRLRAADPSAIVIDEIVAFWLVLWLWLPAGFAAQAAAFALFRFFDAVKPGPVGWADRALHGRGGWAGGFGILLDDLVAALCTLLVLAVAMRALA